MSRLLLLLLSVMIMLSFCMSIEFNIYGIEKNEDGGMQVINWFTTKCCNSINIDESTLVSDAKLKILQDAFILDEPDDYQIEEMYCFNDVLPTEINNDDKTLSDYSEQCNDWTFDFIGFNVQVIISKK